MVTQRELLTAAYNGETPARTPLSIYGRFFRDPRYPRAAFQPLIEMGLGVTHCVETVAAVQHGVSRQVVHKTRGRNRYNYLTMETPVGTLFSVTVTPQNGTQGTMDWVAEPWIKAPDDYRIMQWVAAHTELLPVYEVYEKMEQEIGEEGIVVLGGIRSPAQKIHLEYAGTERFCLDLAREVPELMDLYETERQLFADYHKLVAQGPGRWVWWAENLTIELLGPQRFESLLLNIYEENVPVLETHGKRVFVHFDGYLRVIKDLIARAPFHMVESLTEPPEGDMMYDECRAAWPDKAIAANLNVGSYDLPDAIFRQTIIDKRNRAGKKGFSFEISEEVPANWREKIPLVLDTLENLG